MRIKREDITVDIYRLILDTETHHDHEIVEVNGVLRWLKDPTIDSLVDKLGLNDLIQLFLVLGYDKNSEIYRKLYRDMGYSLHGYWEIFYWDWNHEEANEYVPNAK